MSATENFAGDLHSPSPCKNSSKPPPPPPAVGRKKTAAMGVRAWLAVNSAGEARMVEAGKQAIMRRTGIPARDLRILDPLLSYPSTVLGRERAVVINLEHIKAVITAHELLLLNCRDPIVSPFVHQLQRRLNLRPGHQVRDELEHLLDDDEDMAEMYLTNKLLQQQQTNGSPLSSQSDRACSFNGERIPAEILAEENIENHSHHAISASNNVFGDGHESHTFSTRSSGKPPDVEELEMLLEAYFVQIDSTLNKQSTLREYVDDTEDYINIMLDDKQNHLLHMGVVLMTATLIVSAFVVLVVIFGMNIKVDLFDENKAGTTEFVWTVGGGAAGSLLLYVVVVSWCKHKAP